MPTIPSVRLIQTWQKLSVGMSCWDRHTHVTPPFTHGWLYSHLQLIVTSRNMLVWVVIAIWIKCSGFTNSCIMENVKSGSLTCFSSPSHLSPLWKSPTWPAYFRPHLALEMKRFWKARRFTHERDWGGLHGTSRINRLSVRDLETHWDPAISRSLLGSQSTAGSFPKSAPWHALVWTWF